MSTSKSSPGPKGSSASAKKPPRNPLYISKRKTDGGLFYVRRLPQALIDAGVVSASQPTVRIALGTKDWLTAQTKARQLSAAYDLEWARLRAALVRGPEGCAPANPRKLRPDDIPVLSRRLEALLLYADDIDRSRALTADEFDAYEEELNSQRKALRNANQRSDLAAVADEAIGFLEAEGLDCDESSPHWMSWLKARTCAPSSCASRRAAVPRRPSSPWPPRCSPRHSTCCATAPSTATSAATTSTAKTNPRPSAACSSGFKTSAAMFL